MFGSTMVRGSVVAALRMLGAVSLLSVWVTPQLHAQNLSVLASFGGSDGRYPQGDFVLSGNTLYGATWSGYNGDGSVYSFPASGGSPTVLAWFNYNNGLWPDAGLTLGGSTLYGTTRDGGDHAEGVVFGVPIGGGSPTVLASLDGNNNGAYPQAGLTLNGNTLYGTCANSGPGGFGTVFSLPANGGNPTVLASFSGSNGMYPFAGLTLGGSTLYGTTYYGGTSWSNSSMGYGTVFRLPVNGGSPTVLASFNGSNGANPQASLILIGNTLYGTCSGGGAYGYGTVFSIPINGGSLKVLASFNGSNGASPEADLTVVNNTLYGTTFSGGANGDGTVFSLPLSGGSLTVLASFNGSNGANPFAGLTPIGNNLFYGTAEYGGANNIGTVFRLSVAPATIVLGSTQNAMIITGGTGTVGMAVSNSSTAGYNLNYTLSAAVLSGSVTLGTATSGTLMPGSSQSCTVSATSTDLGSDYISLTASDPNSSNLAQTSTATLTVLGHASPRLSVIAGNNQTVIIGATGITAGLALSNGTLSQSGLASLDVNSLGALVAGSTGGKLVPSGVTQSYMATLTTTTLGTQKEVYSLNAGDDHTLPGASPPLVLSTTATFTVLDHSNASLSPTTKLIRQAISFGNVLRGASVPSQSFTIYNLAANISAQSTANLALTGFTPSNNPAFQTNLKAFNGLSAVSGSNGNAFSVSLNTSNYTIASGTISIAASQLVDDSRLPGAGNNNDGGLAITLESNVGNGTADASNTQTSFGPALIAPVAANGSYANLESTAMTTTGSGGAGRVGSRATILAGANNHGSAQTVSMSWRTQTRAERTSPALISDVVRVTGMALGGGSGQTDPFVLHMTYNPALLPGGAGNEKAWASNRWLSVGWLNPTTGTWENAVDGNYGTNVGTFHLSAWPSSDMTLGDWGVDTANHTAWAVLNHNSDFAVVPEPSTLMLIAAGAVGLSGCGLWRRRK